MKKVLILTYYFPPGSGPGVQRWLKFIKYLPEFGWQPTVVTVKNGSYPNLDASLIHEIPPDTRVIRTNTLEPFTLYNILRGRKGKSIEVGMSNIKDAKSLFQKVSNYVRANYFIPDARKGWVPYVVSATKKLLAQEHFDCLITTGPPHSTHLAGVEIQKKHKIPWIADFRDPWTTIFYNQFLNRTDTAKLKDQHYESLVTACVDGLVVISDGMKRTFQDQTLSICTIHNGYDENDFPKQPGDVLSHFNLAYTGNFKANQDAPVLWRVIKQLISDHDDFSQHFRLCLTGNIAPQIQESLNKEGIMSNVVIEPFVPHLQAVSKMTNSALLLLPIPQSKDSKSILTGKIFEYLASRTPILALGPTDGDAAHLLSICQRSPMLAYQDEELLKRLILDEFGFWKQYGGKRRRIDNSQHAQFTRQALCQRLVHFMEQIIGENEKDHH